MDTIKLKQIPDESNETLGEYLENESSKEIQRISSLNGFELEMAVSNLFDEINHLKGQKKELERDLKIEQDNRNDARIKMRKSQQKNAELIDIKTQLASQNYIASLN